MYDVDGLEKKWKRYKSRQRIPWIVSAAFIVFVALLIFFRADFLTAFSKYSKDDNSSAKIENSVQKSKTLKPFVPTLTPKSESNQSAVQGIAPVKISKETNRTVEKKKVPPMTIEVSDLEAEPVREKRRKYLKIEVTDRYPAKKKQTEKPKKTTKKKKKRTIESVERNFSKSRSYYDSLYLARAYYKKGDYAKSRKWALVTNDLNSKLEESWLIFAKSKAKLGQRREAQQVLSAYIDKTNSAKAKSLLLKIKKGKI
ncbi:MAG: hypothetical protein U9R26_01390 [Campylobacterota bacterium]|nr:hypothetical protein [Campylobacterota bacterium]